jgi:hypothetical protein
MTIAAHDPVSLAATESLNNECFCISTDEGALRKAVEVELDSPGLFNLIHERCPYVFSSYPVFVSGKHLGQMAEVIRAVESVVALPAWREKILASAPAIARHAGTGARGVFLGYDFHLNASGLGLIEINTNAGGAMLNAVLARAQRACCPEVAAMLPSHDHVAAFEQNIVEMFRNEWRLARRDRPLAVIAIVDEAPAQQYLYPEFLLFQQLLQHHGYKVVIAAPEECEFRDGALWHDGIAIDLVYNRLTDFMLEQAASAHLREAYLQNAIVLTPHPGAHALYANKRNLALLSNSAELAQLGVPQSTIDVLATGIPHTEIVQPAHSERLWSERHKLFFKPAAGFGSRAAYRGDKVTKRVWDEILHGDYVAQSIVQPGERALSSDPQAEVLKYDLRNFVYDSTVQWVAARLYQGQTTNFRTPKGGFAPVYTVLPRD